jgi:hypothetical protein
LLGFETRQGIAGHLQEAQVYFAHKHRQLYVKVPPETMLNRALNSLISAHNTLVADFVFRSREPSDTSDKHGSNRTDGYSGLSTDHFVNTGGELPVHAAFLFSSIVTFGGAPQELSAHTIGPTPKKRSLILT